MKKALFTAALLCMISVFAQAQYSTLGFQNNSSCDVYVVIHGSTSGSSCTGDYTSDAIAIPPGASSYADPSLVPGGLKKAGFPDLGPSDEFSSIDVYTSDPVSGCGYTIIPISDCTGLGSSPANTQFYDNTCNVCSSGTTFTLVYNGAGTYVQLDIQ